MKQCARCGEQKDTSAFSTDKTRKDGLQPYCKECNRSYRAANSEQIRERKQREYVQDADRIKRRVGDYRIANQEQVNARRRELHEAKAESKNTKRRWLYALNPGRILDNLRAYRQRNKEKVQARDRQRYIANPERFKVNARNRKARKRAAEGSYNISEWRALKEHYQHSCLRCHRCEPEIQLTPDHVIPLSRGGSNYITNIQPLCLECNLWKSTKTIDYR